ncbi:hypothetical protein IQ226_09605 [Dolichospermum sp. LEGE 00240]|uniref:hypothetical protein n=1 Tax=Dolichospermum sp. LEGE 00240 TaxID=1828603 RepID=UPI00187DE395|nr:hypothetical protein [Dolichospermum sp. LEGE 00240]MBE9249417.1 hypothetical protein [Dolichospermum sp. LEGE 00240]
MQQRFAIAPLQLPKQRFLGRASLSHPSNFPNSDRTPSTSQKRSHPFNSPNSELLAAALRYRTPSNFPKAIASPQLPNSDRIPSTPQTVNCLQQRFAIAPPPTSQKRSHPFNPQTAIASLQPPK